MRKIDNRLVDEMFCNRLHTLGLNTHDRLVGTFSVQIRITTPAANFNVNRCALN